MAVANFPAHFRVVDGEIVEQTVSEHLSGVLERCRELLKPIGLSAVGELCAALHDGKYSNDFRDMMKKAERGEEVKRGSVIHTFFGCRYMLEKGEKAETAIKCLTAELIAFAVGSHHGLFDIFEPNGKDGFKHRMGKDADRIDANYDEILKNYCELFRSEKELDALFESASAEIGSAYERIMAVPELSCRVHSSFTIGLLARLILSALIEADRSDTAAFMLCRSIPNSEPDRAELWKKHLERFESRLSEFSNDGEINTARRQISDKCAEFAKKPGGVWRLQVPTGGGKTLSSLRAALSYAAAHQKKRIIFTIPLLSVIDQNAKVIREYIDDDSLILEHHSNIFEASQKEKRSGSEELDENELIIENWHSPIIITTMVQLLNTIFKGRTSCIRCFHSLIDSVLVIDEVQSVPSRMIDLFNLAVNFLAYFCGCTVILCSATNPCFERIKDHPMKILGDIVPYDEELWRKFKRTELINLTACAMDKDQLAEFIIEKTEEFSSLITICNKKSEAKELYLSLKGCGFRVHHLSTSMCMAHRAEVFAAIRRELAEGENVICISTQLAEAGVDISFGCGVRIIAGLDNAIQTAGRCNRNHESDEPRPVFIVKWKGETLTHLDDIKKAQTASETLFNKNIGELDSPEAVDIYYEKLFKGAGENEYSFQIEIKGTNNNIRSLLSENKSSILNSDRKKGYYLNQAFKTAGEYFEVFDDNTTDIIVPYGDGENIIAEFASERALHDLAYREELAGRSKPYTVAIFRWQREKLNDLGGFFTVCGGSVLVLKKEYYDSDIGVVVEGGEKDFLDI